MTALDEYTVSYIMHPVAPFGVVTTDGYVEHAAIQARGSGSGIGGSDNDVLAEAHFSSFAPGEFTLNWTIADSGMDRAFGWLALPGDIVAPWIPHIYRRVMGT